MHSFQDGQMTHADKHYAYIKFSVSPYLVWDNMWNNLQVRWMMKGNLIGNLATNTVSILYGFFGVLEAPDIWI